MTFVDPNALSNNPPRLVAADDFISTLDDGLVLPNPVLPSEATYTVPVAPFAEFIDNGLAVYAPI